MKKTTSTITQIDILSKKLTLKEKKSLKMTIRFCCICNLKNMRKQTSVVIQNQISFRSEPISKQILIIVEKYKRKKSRIPT